MKQDKTYEEKIAAIKAYLREKEKEVETNKRSEVRKNPIKTNTDVYDEIKSRKKIEEPVSRRKNQEEDAKKITRTEPQVKIKSSAKKNDIKSSQVNESKKTSTKNIKKVEPVIDNKQKTLNTISNVCLFILPIFIFFSFVSLHTTYLVRKPINYASMIMSVLLLIATIVFKVKAKKDRKKYLAKHIIVALGIIIIDAVLLFLFIKNQMWNLLDKLIENKLLVILIFIVLILIFFIIKSVRKMKNKKMKPGTKNILLTSLATLYVLLYIDGLITFYGPSEKFKEWIVTTAMQTMNHQYLCKWFYSQKEIDDIMSQNYVLESGDSTNPDLIDFDNKKTVYENEYEEAVLKKAHKNDPYKIIELDVNGCKAYLAVIYDPTTVKVAATSKLGVAGQYVTTMAENNNALLAINGGGFYDPGNNSAGGTPTGITIVDGKIVTNGEYGTNVQGGGIIGFDDKGVFYLLKNKTAQQAIDMGITNAVSWGPFLIVNGEPSFIKGNGGWGYAARTAIGQRKDGIVLFLVVDSNATRTNGADMVDLTEIMQKYGAINAANLDGGTSSVMVLPKKEAAKYRNDCKDNYCYINDPIDGGLYHSTRAIADAFIVVKN